MTSLRAPAGPILKIPRLRDKDAARRAEAKAWEALCRYLDQRDRMRCRVCKRKVIATLSLVVERREHHHIIPRSAVGGVDTPENVACLCKKCHDDRHVTRVLSIYGNAEIALTCERDGKSWISLPPGVVLKGIK